MIKCRHWCAVCYRTAVGCGDCEDCERMTAEQDVKTGRWRQ